MAKIVLKSVTKVFQGGTTAVKNLDLDIDDGDFIVLVGPSGCGKTTALRMVAGLEEVTSGTIELDGKVINDVDPGDRDIAMVFQNYALYPHMTVFDNIAFPLRCKKVPKDEMQERVKKAASLLGLTDYLQRKPRTLSGGQRQRVAMGRALVREARAFLMDEPLSNLDAKLRVQMRAEISTLQKELGITTIYVTHDQVEAMTMGTKIAVMRLGLLQQFGTPQEVYACPANIFVASFIGSPAMNFIKVQLQKNGGRHQVVFHDEVFEVSEEIIEGRPALANSIGENVVLGMRPEHLQINEGAQSSIKAKIDRIELLGAEKLLYVCVDAEAVSTDEILGTAVKDEGTIESINSGKNTHQANLVVRADSALSVTVGETVDLSVRPGCMHFFDLNSGKSIID